MNTTNYNVQIALGPARLEGETLGDYLVRTSRDAQTRLAQDDNWLPNNLDIADQI